MISRWVIVKHHWINFWYIVSGYAGMDHKERRHSVKWDIKLALWTCDTWNSMHVCVSGHCVCVRVCVHVRARFQPCVCFILNNENSFIVKYFRVTENVQSYTQFLYIMFLEHICARQQWVPFRKKTDDVFTQHESHRRRSHFLASQKKRPSLFSLSLLFQVHTFCVKITVMFYQLASAFPIALLIFYVMKRSVSHSSHMILEISTHDTYTECETSCIIFLVFRLKDLTWC